MNHRLTAEEVAYILDDSDAVAVFASDAFVPMLERVRAGAPRLRHVVLLGGERAPVGRARDDLIAAGGRTPSETPAGLGRGSIDLHRAARPGKPKGALRRGDRSARDRARALRALELRGARATCTSWRGRSITRRPAASRSTRSSSGSTVVVMPQVRRRGGAAARSRAIAAPPPSWRRRCSSASWTCRPRCAPATTSPRCARSSMAAAPCPMRVKEEVLAYFGPVLYEFYGSTELGVEHGPAARGHAAQAGLVRAGRARRGAGDPRRRRAAGAGGRAGRAARAPVVRASSTSTTRTRRRPREMARGEWLTRGRRGLHGRRGLRLHLRPQARHDHLGRREHLPRRDRGRAPPPSRACRTPRSSACRTTEWGERVHAAIAVRGPADASTARRS